MKKVILFIAWLFGLGNSLEIEKRHNNPFWNPSRSAICKSKWRALHQ